MKIAALILGILGGLTGLSLAAYGDMGIGFLSMIGMNAQGLAFAKFVLWGIPIACLVGAGLAPARPGFAGALMLLSAGGWLILGASLWHTINFITGSSVALSGVGGLLAVFAALNAISSSVSVAPTTTSRTDAPAEAALCATTSFSPAALPPPAASSPAASFDKAKQVAYIFGLVLTVILVVVVAIDNGAPMTISLWPLPWAVGLPGFIVFLSLPLLGFLVGAAAAWLSGAKTRKRVRDLAETSRAQAHQNAEQERRYAVSRSAPVARPGNSA